MKTIEYFSEYIHDEMEEQFSTAQREIKEKLTPVYYELAKSNLFLHSNKLPLSLKIVSDFHEDIKELTIDLDRDDGNGICINGVYLTNSQLIAHQKATGAEEIDYYEVLNWVVNEYPDDFVNNGFDCA